MPPTLDPPRSDEVEVSLFGPSYGESVVIHLGHNEWIIVDSCQNLATKKPIPLEYLERIQVPPTTAVKLVLATHWHDDHIRGLASVFRACQTARFACSAAMGKEEFHTLVAAMTERSMMTNTGVSEFTEIFNILKTRKANNSTLAPQVAIEDRRLWHYAPDVNTRRPLTELWSLSPSDATVAIALTNLATLAPKVGSPKRRIPDLRPNHASVVLLVSIGQLHILLGADLENTVDAGRGWTAILNNPRRPQGKASIFKIPHHGSKTADDPRVWATMLQPQPFALLTPFVRANRTLPTRPDVARICAYTNNAYSTTSLRPPRLPRRPKMVERTIEEIVKRIQPVPSSLGQLRLRTTLDGNNPWSIDTFTGACRLDQIYRDHH